MKMFVSLLGLIKLGYAIFCHIQSTIYLRKNLMYHSHTKHIDVRYHWLCLAIDNQLFQLKKFRRDDNFVGKGDL